VFELYNNIMLQMMFFILSSICLCARSSLICTKQPGFCVKDDGRDQNSGVIKLNSLDGNTRSRQDQCLKLCLRIPGVTGCEVIWDQGNRGCYAHTQSVSRGNRRARHMCWICRPKPTPVCIKEAGFCVKQDGRDQNSGVIKLNDLDGNTVKRQEDCFKLCLTKPGVTGCEVIWHQGNRGCYAHTQPVSRGNNVDRHMCWICDKKPTLTCSKEAGFCVKQDGRDQNSGVVKLNSVDGNTLKSQEDCLKLCLATDGVTGCEVIWDQGNRGCYAHTQSVARGNGVARHMCWICGDVPTPKKPTPACIKEAGFCVKQDGRDQNSGVIKLNDLDGNTVRRQEDCLKLCLARPGVTGCEVIWNQGNRGCYAHTQPVSRGNNVDRHKCWICDQKPALTCSKEVGFCVKQDGGDQNSGVVKLNSVDGNTLKSQQDCLKLCLATPRVTGCEVIWDQGNRGCYAHTQSVARGNGVPRHMCWVCKSL